MSIRWLLLYLFVPLLGEENYFFYGRHYLASYLECDAQALSDTEALLSSMDAAVEASHATILERTHHCFSPSGLTIVYLLSESHASIHTYPEEKACFVDLFTCGSRCDAREFERLLCDYLRPQKVNAKIFSRFEEIKELP